MLSKIILFSLFIQLSYLLYAQNNKPSTLFVTDQQQNFAQWLYQNHQSEQKKLHSIIDQQKLNKWSKDQAGNISLLYGLSPSGLPDYITTAYSTPAAATVGTDKLWEFGSIGLNLSGNNSILKNRLAMWDGGLASTTHIELSGRITAGESGIAVSGHSTSVAGIMIDKAINPGARGMAYGLEGIISYDFYNDVAEMAAASSNLLFSNHSYIHICGWNYRNTSDPSASPRWEFWGGPNDTEDYNFGYYNSLCRNVDSIAFNAPFYTIVKAAGNNRTSNGPAIGDSYWRRDSSGNWIQIAHRDAYISSNDGYDIISILGNAKNIITVGAVSLIPNGYTQAADVKLGSYSSWGPSDDGRIKPDIVAPGENILTASAESDSSYNLFGATSAATPVATGSLLLLQQLQYNISKSFLRASTIKALVVHTANEAGTSPGPDYMHGWGLLNVEKAANVISNQDYSHLLFEHRLMQGTDTSFKVIASGNGSLIFTICWTDPPGNVDAVNYKNNRSPKLVNDLDISVSDGNSAFLPWALDATNPALPATQRNNTVDNVEKIEIPDAVAGKEYTVRISHKGTLRNGFQDYSFVASAVNGVKTTDKNPIGLIVLPNPATNNCMIRFKPLNNSNVIVSILGENGQKIKQEAIAATFPITNYPMNISFLHKGVYFISLQQANKISTVKMEKL